MKTTRVIGEAGRVVAIETTRVDGNLQPIPGSEARLPCDLLLLAMGFVGPVPDGLVRELGLALDARGNVATRDAQTSVPGVFAAGDMARGQSLVVWAIAEGRKAATAVHRWFARRHTPVAHASLRAP